MIKTKRLEKLYDICLDCKACSLYKTRTKLVFGDGGPDAKIVFVGEAPGKEEDLSGRPFVGRSGKLLRLLIQAIKIPDKDYYIANILKDRPPNNRAPNPEEIKTCVLYLKKQLEIINPKILVLLGKTSVVGFLPKYKDYPMGALRNQQGSFFFKDIPIIVTYHPSALLRNPSLKVKSAEDFRYIQKISSSL